jgi:hypothetical protein
MLRSGRLQRVDVPKFKRINPPGAMAALHLPTLHRFVTELLPDVQLTLPTRYRALMSSREALLFAKVFNTNVEMAV